MKTIMVEHYMAILPFKPNTWVLCHQPTTLEEATFLIEAYEAVFDPEGLEEKWQPSGRRGMPV